MYSGVGNSTFGLLHYKDKGPRAALQHAGLCLRLLGRFGLCGGDLAVCRSGLDSGVADGACHVEDHSLTSRGGSRSGELLPSPAGGALRCPLPCNGGGHPRKKRAAPQRAVGLLSVFSQPAFFRASVSALAS